MTVIYALIRQVTWNKFSVDFTLQAYSLFILSLHIYENKSIIRTGFLFIHMLFYNYAVEMTWLKKSVRMVWYLYSLTFIAGRFKIFAIYVWPSIISSVAGH